MGKRRKLSQKGQAHTPKASISGRNQKPKSSGGSGGSGGGSSSNSNSSAAPGAGKPTTKKQQQQQQQQQRPVEPTIPFAPEDKILLIGDGDLSFAASLIEHHYCADVTATVLEKTLDELRDKYPHVEENIAKIEAEDGKVLYGVDATKMAPFTDHRRGGGDGGEGVMDRILFNFPHVGGKSTDVNRQVRYNQELLVAFFGRAAPSLAPGGAIVVTLFEGEPYTLWNVRDLARHAGLQVARSFAFQAAAYPGYRHARTLGVVRNRDGAVGGGWRGEDRPARSYVFVRKDDAPPVPQKKKKGKKRARNDDSDSSDDE